MTELTDIRQIPTIGKIVLVIYNGMRSPCRKFLGEMGQAIEIVESSTNPANGSYFMMQLNQELKEKFFISTMPLAIIMVDGVEKKRFEGHWNYHFQMAEMINEGFSK